MAFRLTGKDLAVAHDTIYGSLYGSLCGKFDQSAFNYDKYAREDALENIDIAMRCLETQPIAKESEEG